MIVDSFKGDEVLRTIVFEVIETGNSIFSHNLLPNLLDTFDKDSFILILSSPLLGSEPAYFIANRFEISFMELAKSIVGSLRLYILARLL